MAAEAKHWKSYDMPQSSQGKIPAEAEGAVQAINGQQGYNEHQAKTLLALPENCFTLSISTAY